MDKITHIKISQETRNLLKIIAIQKNTTLQKLTDKIFADYLKKFESRKPYNTHTVTVDKV